MVASDNVHETEKSQKLLTRGFNSTKNTGFFNINVRNKWKRLFLFHNWFPLEFVLHKYLLDMVRHKPQVINVYNRVVKRKSKVQEKNMS